MIPYSSTATDLIAQATQMEQAQLTIPDCGFVDCPLMAKAMSEIGASKPALSVPLWNDLPGAAFPGGDLPHSIAGEATANLSSPQDPGVTAYFKTIEASACRPRTRQPVLRLRLRQPAAGGQDLNEIPFA